MSVENWQRGGFGLYIHWPFCEAKCPYCDFNSFVSQSIDQSRWRNAYLSELDRVAEETQGRVLDSVFFGGGTPSLMEPETVAAILDKVAALWSTSNQIEITLEANPSSVEAQRFASYASAGVNRVSLGVQALNDTDLKRLGRLHSLDDAMRALDVARTTFKRFSFDLIYARQDQSLTDWQAELTQALSFKPDHLSAYQLTIEDGTAFGDRHARGKLSGLPPDDLAAEMFELTQDMTKAADLPAYEVSNHAKPGEASRHNLIYWRGGDYLGIGPGAHGRLTLGGTRLATETHLTPGAWLNKSEAGSGESTRSRMSQDDTATEYLMMALRTEQGADIAHLKHIGIGHQYDNKIKELCDGGFLTISGEALKVPVHKRIVLNAILAKMLS